MVQAAELHKAGSLQDVHQMVRWIGTKEEHASKIMHTVGDYFMAQKVRKAELSKERCRSGRSPPHLAKNEARPYKTIKLRQFGYLRTCADERICVALDQICARLDPILPISGNFGRRWLNLG